MTRSAKGRIAPLTHPEPSRQTQFQVLLGSLEARLIAVQLAAPLDGAMSVSEAITHLVERQFDLALIDDPGLRIVRLRTLRDADPGLSICEVSEAPRRSQLVEGSMPMGMVVEKLTLDSEPLLVVGHLGVTHVITVADFASVAGTAVVLTAMTVLDAEMDAHIQSDQNRCMKLMSNLDDKERDRVVKRQARANKDGAQLPLASYVGFTSRLATISGQKWVPGFTLDDDQFQLLERVRNSTAHGARLQNSRDALRALRLTLTLLDVLAPELVGPPGHD
jgi:hypothetical protein